MSSEDLVRTGGGLASTAAGILLLLGHLSEDDVIATSPLRLSLQTHDATGRALCTT